MSYSFVSPFFFIELQNQTTQTIQYGMYGNITLVTKKVCQNNIRPPAPTHTPANKVSEATVAIAKERLRQVNK